MSQYTNGSYLTNNPGWHEEDAPCKAAWVTKLLTHNGVSPRSVVEVGSGSGAILASLEKTLPEAQTFDGYDISPQAHELAARRVGGKLRFNLGAPPPDARYDLAMAIDVAEHVEDCFSFVRSLKALAPLKVLHIPLDMTVLAAARAGKLAAVRKSVGHIHYFNKGTALAFLEECGLRVVDWAYTDGALSLPQSSVRTRITNQARRVIGGISKDGAARWLGGYSMMVLAE